jgi:hypothetical protein
VKVSVGVGVKVLVGVGVKVLVGVGVKVLVGVGVKVLVGVGDGGTGVLVFVGVGVGGMMTAAAERDRSWFPPVVQGSESGLSLHAPIKRMWYGDPLIPPAESASTPRKPHSSRLAMCPPQESTTLLLVAEISNSIPLEADEGIAPPLTTFSWSSYAIVPGTIVPPMVTILCAWGSDPVRAFQLVEGSGLTKPVVPAGISAVV